MFDQVLDLAGDHDLFRRFSFSFIFIMGKTDFLNGFEKINGNVPSNPNARAKSKIFKLINSVETKNGGFQG